MKAVPAPESTLAADCYAPLSNSDILALHEAGIKAVARYPETITAVELTELLQYHLVFFVVTSPRGGYSPTVGLAMAKHAAAAAKLQSLGVPATTSVFVDLEGMGGTYQEQLAYAEGACSSLQPYTPGIYAGAGIAMTGHELYSVPSAKRYWKSGSRVTDRFNYIVEPDCGWCCVQAPKFNVTIPGGVGNIDNDWMHSDYEGRAVICVSA